MGFERLKEIPNLHSWTNFPILFVQGNGQVVYIVDWLLMDDVNVHDDMASIFPFRTLEPALRILVLFVGRRSDPCQVLWADEGPISLVMPW